MEILSNPPSKSPTGKGANLVPPPPKSPKISRSNSKKSRTNQDSPVEHDASVAFNLETETLSDAPPSPTSDKEAKPKLKNKVQKGISAMRMLAKPKLKKKKAATETGEDALEQSEATLPEVENTEKVAVETEDATDTQKEDSSAADSSAESEVESEREYWDGKSEGSDEEEEQESSVSSNDFSGGGANAEQELQRQRSRGRSNSDAEEHREFQKAVERKRRQSSLQLADANPKAASELEHRALVRRYLPYTKETQAGRQVVVFTAEQEVQFSEQPSAPVEDTEGEKELALFNRRKAMVKRNTTVENGVREKEDLVFKLLWEEDPEFPIYYVQTTADKVQLKKAVEHYRSPSIETANTYHCLVNLGCCFMSLNQPRSAKPLFEQAAQAAPRRAAAQINLVGCCLRIHDKGGALLAIETALASAEDTTAEQHRLLLRSKKSVISSMGPEKARKYAKKSAMRTMTGTPKEGRSMSPKRGRGKLNKKQTNSQFHQPASRMQVWEMRKELLSISSNARDGKRKDMVPAWGRTHAYAGERGEGILKQKARWQPLKPEEVVALKREFARGASGGASGTSATDSESSEQDDDAGSSASSAEASAEDETGKPGPQGRSCRRAYATVKGLPCMQMLPPKKARALLRASELDEFSAGDLIFRQGDFAHQIFIIVRGSVMLTKQNIEWGPDPVPVETMYDGQVFGDASVSSWRGPNSDGHAKRELSAVAQEETILLKLFPEAYRTAMGAAEQSTPSPRKGRKEEEDDQMTELLPEVKRKVQALAESPYFKDAPRRTLVLLASNTQEVELRYGDVFVAPGQALQACFLIAEGHLRLSVPPIDWDKAGTGSLHDVARITGMGRLPEVPAEGAEADLQDKPLHRSGDSRPKESEGAPPGMAGLRASIRRYAQRTSDASETGQALPNPSPALMVQFGKRPPLLPPAKTLKLAATAVGGDARSSRLTPRKPGTPRRGTTYEESFRKTRVAPFALVSPHPDVEIDFLWPGDAFGLATLLDPRGECPYPSGCEVRVQSCEARILVLTQRSLLYLADPFARKLVERLQAKQDPVAPSLADLRGRRSMQSKWIVKKKQVLERTIMFDD